MSAGAQIQMAPQASVTATQPAHSQDSNMSTGNNPKILHNDRFPIEIRLIFFVRNFQVPPIVTKRQMLSLLKNPVESCAQLV